MEHIGMKAYTEDEFWKWADWEPTTVNEVWTTSSDHDAVMERLIEKGILERHVPSGKCGARCYGARTRAQWHYGFTPEWRVLRALRFAP